MLQQKFLKSCLVRSSTAPTIQTYATWLVTVSLHAVGMYAMVNDSYMMSSGFVFDNLLISSKRRIVYSRRTQATCMHSVPATACMSRQIWHSISRGCQLCLIDYQQKTAHQMSDMRHTASHPTCSTSVHVPQRIMLCIDPKHFPNVGMRFYCP